MKNLNSFKAIARAIEHEANRQMDLLASGEAVIQETRRWDDARGCSYAMRSKEDAKDYRYFPDPDLVPVHISDAWIAEVKARQPEFRTEKIMRYQEEFGLPYYDAEILTGSKKLADFFESAVTVSQKPKKVSNWLMGETMRLLREQNMEADEIRFSPKHLAELIHLTDAGVINSTGLMTVNDESALRGVVSQVIKENPKSVEDYRGGKEKAIGFLVGQTMKAMKGKANPESVHQMLKEFLAQ